MTQKNSNLKHILGDASQPGAVICNKGIMFTTYTGSEKSLFLLIYDGGHKLVDRVDMLEFKVNSAVCSCIITGLDAKDISYIYEADGVTVADSFAKASTGKRKYKECSDSPDEAKIYFPDFDWEGDKPLQLKFNDIVSYQLHVRGFTAHYSSKVKNRGKFAGITEKIGYLTDLGINQVILMPAYEFDEFEKNKKSKFTSYLDYTRDLNEADKEEDQPKINYWGFKEGLYYSPKASYAGGDAVYEFKTMVKELHKAGIEVIMRFYFNDSFNRSLIPDILKFWVRDYHVDGFFIMGNNIPMDMLSADPFLRDVKLYNVFFEKQGICDRDYGYNHNMAFVNPDFSACARKYLKSDEDMLHDFLFRQRLNPTDVHVINYITDYEGFTLNDLVSYDYKHNEDNGENNRDGENYNYSWNCGYEGHTRKQSVMNLRQSQIKNAICFLLLAQGIPMLLAGDEFLNSQNGNNNPYCQDNETGWLVWKNTRQAEEIHDFTKKMIKLRKEHPILHPENEFRIMDYAACGYPDLSYHSENAWAPKFDNHLRNIGIMLCGLYKKVDRVTNDDFFYIAYNMHWEDHPFGLPKLPKNYRWEVLLTTYKGPMADYNQLSEAEDFVLVPGRYVTVLHSVKYTDEAALIPNNKSNERKEE